MVQFVPESERVLSIDCDECALQHSAACADCVVTFLCGDPASSPVVVDLTSRQAVPLPSPLQHRAAAYARAHPFTTEVPA